MNPQDFADFISWLLDIALWSIFWYFVLQAFNTLMKLRDIKNQSEDLREHMENHLEMVLHNVKEESHDGITYWFDDDNDQFLAQGETLSDVKQHLKDRFKDHIFIFKDKFVFVGPDYEDQEFSGEEEITKYVAQVILERSGLQVVDK
jgi:hypothetical protein